MINSKSVTNLLKEPLLHFLLIGAALFVLYGWTSVPGGHRSRTSASSSGKSSAGTLLIWPREGGQGRYAPDTAFIPVLVTKRVGVGMPELKEVRDRVKLDWTAEKQKELKDAAYAKILESYNVTVERPKQEILKTICNFM